MSSNFAGTPTALVNAWEPALVAASIRIQARASPAPNAANVR
jgi:hypothetical protein